MSRVQLILDTDMDMDVDDVGALAMCHALADRGELDLLGVVCDSPSPSAAACVHVLNASRGRSEIPVGSVYSAELARRLDYIRQCRGITLRGNFFYNLEVARMNPEAACQPVWNSTKLYRKLLSEAEDGAVVICCIGFLTALSDLLSSEPDEYCDLDGHALVVRKVKKLVTMAEAYPPDGYEICNWAVDPQASFHVLKDWPTETVVTPLGRNVWNGSLFAKTLQKNDPVHRAYEIYFGESGRSQQSWDLVAVYYCVRGRENLFKEEGEGHCYFHVANSMYHWGRVSPNFREHILLRQIADDREVEERIDAVFQ